MTKLHVFMNGKQLGEIVLADDRGLMELVYSPDWVADGGFAVSPHLPPGASSSQSLKDFLSNLLPEGRWLEDLSMRTACSKANIFGLIAAIGAETAGALSFSLDIEGSPPLTAFREVPLKELTERISARETVSIAMWDEKPRLSVAGVQDKLPMLIYPDGVMGFGEGELASTHLLKFGKDPELHLVINEYLCMRLARAVGIPVAEVTLERFGEPVLAVRRFDRRWQDGRVDRLHLIDGCQMLDLPPTYKYERPFGKGGHAAGIRTGASLEHLFSACRKFCNVPAAALNNLLDWTLFQLVIGNSDAHGKNISFFVGREGISPAPAYDLLNLEVYGSAYDRDLAMAIGDSFDPDEIAPYQLAEMCEECRLPKRQVARSLDVLCEKTLRAIKMLELPELTTGEGDFADRLKSSIAANASRLQLLARELPKVRL